MLVDSARRSYRRRLAELDKELGDADADADLVRAERLRAERSMVVDELAGDRVGERPRIAGDPAVRRQLTPHCHSPPNHANNRQGVIGMTTTEVAPKPVAGTGRRRVLTVHGIDQASARFALAPGNKEVFVDETAPSYLGALARRAGYTRVEIVPIDHPFWRFYRLTP